MEFFAWSAVVLLVVNAAVDMSIEKSRRSPESRGVLMKVLSKSEKRCNLCNGIVLFLKGFLMRGGCP